MTVWAAAATVTDQDDQIILALIAIVATSIAALVYTIRNNSLGKAIARDTAQVNDAVNHREFGERRLFEIVKQIEAKQDEFDRKWGNLPAEMGDAVGLAELIHGMSKRIDKIDTDLTDHVKWEQDVQGKYREGP